MCGSGRPPCGGVGAEAECSSAGRWWPVVVTGYRLQDESKESQSRAPTLPNPIPKSTHCARVSGACAAGHRSPSSATGGSSLWGLGIELVGGPSITTPKWIDLTIMVPPPRTGAWAGRAEAAAGRLRVAHDRGGRRVQLLLVAGGDVVPVLVVEHGPALEGGSRGEGQRADEALH